MHLASKLPSRFVTRCSKPTNCPSKRAAWTNCIVYTEFKSMVVQEPKILRLLPIHVGDAKEMGEEIVPDQERPRLSTSRRHPSSSSPH